MAPACSDDPPKQKPTIFWIGCADARVSEAKVVPGKEIFVQRNVANQFHATDTNAAACLAYVVAALDTVTEIWVVGHTDCGGVKTCYNAAHSPPPPGNLDSSIWTWLGSLLTLALIKRNLTLRQLTDENVRVQVANVKATLVALKARPITVKGYVYVLGKKPGEGVLEEIK